MRIYVTETLENITHFLKLEKEDIFHIIVQIKVYR